MNVNVDDDDTAMDEYGSSSVVRLRDWWGSGSLGILRPRVLGGRGASMNINLTSGNVVDHNQHMGAASANLTTATPGCSPSLAQRANILRRRMIIRKRSGKQQQHQQQQPSFSEVGGGGGGGGGGGVVVLGGGGGDMMFDHDESAVPVAKGDRVMLHSLDDASSDDDDDDDIDDDDDDCGSRNRTRRTNHNHAQRQTDDEVSDHRALNGRLGVVLVPQAKPGYAGICLTNGPHHHQERNAVKCDDQLDRMLYVRYENLRVCDENMTTAKHLHRPRPAVRFQE